MRVRAGRPPPGLLIAGPLALAGALLVGGFAGIAVGAVLAAAAIVMAARRETPQARHRRERVTADLPFAADLMASCMRAGQPLGRAVDATARAIGGPLGESLSWAATQIRLGADPTEAWEALGADPSLAPLARAMTRAARSGAPLADVLTRLADDARLAARATASAAARRAGVQVVAPLGLCFLPAFVFLGIIPVVAGLAAEIALP
ncbi:type II secretion system F family protein [Microbispora sp. RL4-1S]|uniref:Type II secretion system F family protein n=1 Tax=Microbispora oryzae TaxID=2806554 RepID=A0A941ALH1_9ACTN|nr:type II secretion system F family protein [Microbispora oryzae]MBP2707247.1 type II secretion system F family protein [Microbispora oryzae]